MVATIKTTISMQKALFDQVETLAQQLNISQSRLCEIAIAHYVETWKTQTHLDEINERDEAQPVPYEQASSSGQDAKPATPIGREGKAINQGDIYWIEAEEASRSELGYYPHPYVVIQDNLFNYSRISTLVVCALTSNPKQAKAPGNVLLDVGEANLPKQSVVVVSKVSTVEKTQLGEYIGSLSQQRINQILAGLRFLHDSFFAR